jgi:FtsP/CotA-like multicopper oxidase with cupredoxin domain
MKRLTFLSLAMLVSVTYSQAATLKKSLHINTGQLTAPDSAKFFYLSYNETPVFSQQSALITLNANDSLQLTVYNHDSVQHRFHIEGGSTYTVNPSDSATSITVFTTPGMRMFYDDQSDRASMYCGLSGIIAVLEPSKHTRNFYWNIRSHQKAWNDQLGFSLPPAGSYDPDYYSINGQSYPVNNTDNTAKINGNVGDTIRLYLCNGGYSTHSIHFHGYHGKVISTTSKKLKTGWIKDTFPLESKETLVIEIVPDKAGLFPVHDHNLAALASGALHPSGMLIMMEVK